MKDRLMSQAFMTSVRSFLTFIVTGLTISEVKIIAYMLQSGTSH